MVFTWNSVELKEGKPMKHTRWGISLAADVSAPRKA